METYSAAIPKNIEKTYNNYNRPRKKQNTISKKNVPIRNNVINVILGCNISFENVGYFLDYFVQYYLLAYTIYSKS